ncbi:MAG: putative membrane protein, partial [uncultured Nocardioidaceae bacterium]
DRDEVVLGGAAHGGALAAVDRGDPYPRTGSDVAVHRHLPARGARLRPGPLRGVDGADRGLGVRGDRAGRLAHRQVRRAGHPARRAGRHDRRQPRARVRDVAVRRRRRPGPHRHQLRRLVAGLQRPDRERGQRRPAADLLRGQLRPRQPRHRGGWHPRRPVRRRRGSRHLHGNLRRRRRERPGPGSTPAGTLATRARCRRTSRRRDRQHLPGDPASARGALVDGVDLRGCVRGLRAVRGRLPRVRTPGGRGVHPYDRHRVRRQHRGDRGAPVLRAVTDPRAAPYPGDDGHGRRVGAVVAVGRRRWACAGHRGRRRRDAGVHGRLRLRRDADAADDPGDQQRPRRRPHPGPLQRAERRCVPGRSHRRAGDRRAPSRPRPPAGVRRPDGPRVLEHLHHGRRARTQDLRDGQRRHRRRRARHDTDGTGL